MTCNFDFFSIHYSHLNVHLHPWRTNSKPADNIHVSPYWTEYPYDCLPASLSVFVTFNVGSDTTSGRLSKVLKKIRKCTCVNVVLYSFYSLYCGKSISWKKITCLNKLFKFETKHRALSTRPFIHFKPRRSQIVDLTFFPFQNKTIAGCRYDLSSISNQIRTWKKKK